MQGINPSRDGEMAKYLALAAGKTQRKWELDLERKKKEKAKRRAKRKKTGR